MLDMDGSDMDLAIMARMADTALQMADEIDKLKAERDQLLEVLKAVEWVFFTSFGFFCPACGQRKNDGHAENCKLSNALKITGDKP